MVGRRVGKSTGNGLQFRLPPRCVCWTLSSLGCGGWFLPLEVGIPTLAKAVRFVPPLFLRCHLTNFPRIPFWSATATACEQME
jgi:hypothetical protein